MKTKFTSVALVLMMALGVLVTASQVLGEPFPYSPGLSGTDGAFLTGCWDDTGSVPVELNTHITYFNWLGLNLHLTMNATCDNTTDLRFDDNLTSSMFSGLWMCTVPGGNFGWTASTADVECDQSTVQLNEDGIEESSFDPALLRQHIWCHESGHAVGLWHDSQIYFDCMKLGEFELTHYEPHNINHLRVY